MAIFDAILDLPNRARNALVSWIEEGRTAMIYSEKEKISQNLIITARRYYNGKHEVVLIPRQQAWLDLHSKADLQFNFNHCGTVIDALVERLKVSGFKTQEDNKELAKFLWNWWQANRMDVGQIETHKRAVRDGETFVLSQWNKEEKYPEWIIHERYVDKSVGGEGFGMYMVYPQDNPLLKPEYAVKRWEETIDGKLTMFKNLYYPEKIVNQIFEGRKWVTTDTKPNTFDGKPLGIPVAHFKNPDLYSEIKDIIPIQDALNKTWLDALASSDASAFRTLITIGFIPTKDGKNLTKDQDNLVQVAPGQMMYTLTPKQNADVHVVEPVSLASFLDMEERIVNRIASISDTPLSRFQTAKQIPSDETQKQMDAPLISKVEERQGAFGNAWEDLCYISLKQAKAYEPSEVLEFDDSVEALGKLSTVWHPAEVRSEKSQVAVAKEKKEIGVPLETILVELGYSEKEIAEIKQSPEVIAYFKTLEMSQKAADLLGDGDER